MIFAIILLWMFCQNHAWASPQKVAVLDLIMTPEDSTIRTLLEDEIRSVIFQSTQPDTINITTRETTKILLEQNPKPFRCLSLSCMNEIARSIGTEFVIFGTIDQRDEQWTLALRLFEQRKNIIVATAEITKPNIMSLTESLNRELDVFIQELPGQSRERKIQVPIVSDDVPQKERVPEVHSQKPLRFHFLSFQCTKQKSGFNLIGYCHSGVFLGPVHIGGIVYSRVEGMFLGGIQTSIYNNTNNFLGVLQMGIVNGTLENHFGFQMAVYNDAKHLYGGQVGIVNHSENTYGVQMGVVNSTGAVYGLQAGLINNTKHVYGFQAGLINTTEYLYGIQLGFLNFSKNNAAPVTVGINIGW